MTDQILVQTTVHCTQIIFCKIVKAGRTIIQVSAIAYASEKMSKSIPLILAEPLLNAPEKGYKTKSCPPNSGSTASNFKDWVFKGCSLLFSLLKTEMQNWNLPGMLQGSDKALGLLQS